MLFKEKERNVTKVNIETSSVHKHRLESQLRVDTDLVVQSLGGRTRYLRRELQATASRARSRDEIGAM